jgi:hypothetical protein
MPLLLSRTRWIVAFFHGRCLYVGRSFVVATANFQVLPRQLRLHFCLATERLIAKVAPLCFGCRSSILRRLLVLSFGVSVTCEVRGSSSCSGSLWLKHVASHVATHTEYLILDNTWTLYLSAATQLLILHLIALSAILYRFYK